MGTLFNQSPRNYYLIENDDLENEIDELLKIAKRKKISLSEVIEIKKILELSRRNNLFVSNGDAWDEQIAGIGAILEKILEKENPNE